MSSKPALIFGQKKKQLENAWEFRYLEESLSLLIKKKSQFSFVLGRKTIHTYCKTFRQFTMV